MHAIHLLSVSCDGKYFTEPADGECPCDTTCSVLLLLPASQLMMVHWFGLAAETSQQALICLVFLVPASARGKLSYIVETCLCQQF